MENGLSNLTKNGLSTGEDGFLKKKKTNGTQSDLLEHGIAFLAFIRKQCEKTIRMKYGSEGIQPQYLSGLCPQKRLNGLKETYDLLSELIHDYCKTVVDDYNCFIDNGIRFLISGDVYSGRTTQLLYFCHEALADPDKVVFYISPYSLNNMSVFRYIYNTYLKNLPDFTDLEPREAFRKFKSTIGSDKRIYIIVDDYAYVNKQYKDEFDHVFKHEDQLIDNVDVIIKVRYKDASWPQNYLNIAAVGVSETTIKKAIRLKGIEYSTIHSIINSLKSPWLLMLLINSGSFYTSGIVNPGQLIRHSIGNRVETLSQSSTLSKDILAFSVYALLPNLTIENDFRKNHLYEIMPLEVNNAIKSGVVSECFEVDDEFEQLSGSNKKVFNEFFKRPIVDIMGLMQEPSHDDRSLLSYEWKDLTIENYFFATAILNLINVDRKEEALELINYLSNNLLSIKGSVLQKEIDSFAFVCFDRAKYLLDLIDDVTLNALQKTGPRQIALLLYGIATMHELLGNEDEKLQISIMVLKLLYKMYTDSFDDKLFLAKYFSKSSYYIIKYKVKNKHEEDKNQDFPSFLLYAKECLEVAIQIIEGHQNLTVQELFEISKMYGNMGAYYLRQKEYNEAIVWHEKSLNQKKYCIHKCEAKDKQEIEEGIRRSLVSLATDYYYLKDYEKSIKYHDKAIEIGERIHSLFRYESYSRKVGSSIKLYNERKIWSLDYADILLETLIDGLNIMGQMINRSELNDIYKLCKSILSALSDNSLYFKTVVSIKTKALEIESRYNMITWNDSFDVSKFFKEEA